MADRDDGGLVVNGDAMAHQLLAIRSLVDGLLATLGADPDGEDADAEPKGDHFLGDGDEP